MSKILLTGGAGFIGSHLTGRLLKLGYHVTVVDNLYSGFLHNISEFSKNKNFKFIQTSVINPITIETDFTHILNLACPASPPSYQKDPIYTTKTSVLGVINTAEFAIKCNAEYFHTSTSEVYGDPKLHPQKENYWGNVNPCGPRSCYDEGKRCSESLIFDYSKTRNLKAKVVRIFNTYGPQMDPNDGRVITNFLHQALLEKDLTVYGDGSQTRSFCYIDDLVDGILKYFHHNVAFDHPINLGNPSEFKIIDLAKKVIGMTSSSSKISYRPLPQDDPIQRCPNITMAKEKLKWAPQFDLDSGLLKTINWFKERI